MTSSISEADCASALDITNKIPLGGLTVNLQEADKIMRLLENATSIPVVRNFLKKKNLRHSAGSWNDLYEYRIKPALVSGELILSELTALLQRSEEHGSQHIFLFECSPDRAALIIARPRIERILDEAGLASLLNQPVNLLQVEQPTIVEVRLEGGNLLIKEIECRKKFVPFGEAIIDPVNKTIVRACREEVDRVVNIAKLHANGLLELRIASHDNSSKYHEDVGRFFMAISPFINKSDFRELYITRAKTRFFDDRDRLKDLVRYSDYTLRNDLGTTLKASTATSVDDLSNDDSAINSLNEFGRDDVVTCLSSNLYFKVMRGDDTHEIHVLLSGELNEYAITTSCTPEEYEYVLEQIRAHNA